MHATRIHSDALELARLLKPSWGAITDALERSGVPTCLRDEDALKAKLKKVEEQLASARDERVGLVQARDEARAAFAGSDSLSQDSDEFQAAQAAVAALGACDDRIAELQAIQVGTLKMLGRDPEQPEQRGRGGAGDGSDPRAAMWNSHGLLADDDIRQRLMQASHSKSKFGGIEIGEVASRDALVADITGTTAMRRGDYAGIVPQLRRRLSVLDLIPTGTMDNNSFPYTKESGSFGTAAETAEGIAKSEAALTLTDDEAFAATIAHWLKIRKQGLADVPALQSIIDGRLRYGVLRRLEGQVLAGDGAGANMRGILQTSGLGAVTFAAGNLVTDQVLKGITTVMLADAEATGIVLHPTDWQTALLAKSTYTAQAGVTGGSGEYFSGGPFEVTPQQMWGVPLVPSVAVAQGTALVGDFAIGAQLLIREGVQVLLSDSDQDDFIKNRVTMLAEMRAALPVFRPAAFATVALQ
jgi:HK97 family phage major capsid protein